MSVAMGLLIAGVIAGWLWWDEDDRTAALLLNTVKLGLGACLVAVPIGTFLAVLIHRTDVPGRRIAWALLIAFLFIPLYLQAAGWENWFGRQGWLWPAQDIASRRLSAAIWIHAVAAIPWVAVIVGAGLQQIAPELEESALLDMPTAAVLRRVTLPLSSPAVLVAAWWVFVMTAGDMTVTDLYQVRTFAEEVYTVLPLLDASGPGGSNGAALPGGTAFLAALMLISLAAVDGVARHEFLPTPRPRLTMELRGGKLVSGCLLWSVVLVITFVPLANLCFDAGFHAARTGEGGVVRGWSAWKCLVMILTSPWRFRGELAWTMAISTGAAMVAAAAAALLAWAARRRSLAALPAWTAVCVASAIPGPLVALGVIRLLNQEDIPWLLWLYDRTLLAPVLAGAVRALPAAILIIWWGCRTITPDLVDMARLDGQGFFGQIRHLVLPLRWRVIAVAGWVAMAIAAGDLSATLLVTPPGVSTLATRVFGLLHAGVDDQVAGICLTNMLFCALLAAAAWRLFQAPVED
jgi:iron(III) transport system permease protein